MNPFIRNRQTRARARLYATDKQKTLLKRLLIEAFAHRSECFNLDYHHLETTAKDYASEVIGKLIEAQKAGWPRTRSRCADCGKVGEVTGHQECEYPQDH